MDVLRVELGSHSACQCDKYIYMTGTHSPSASMLYESAHVILETHFLILCARNAACKGLGRPNRDYFVSHWYGRA